MHLFVSAVASCLKFYPLLAYLFTAAAGVGKLTLGMTIDRAANSNLLNVKFEVDPKAGRAQITWLFKCSVRVFEPVGGPPEVSADDDMRLSYRQRAGLWHRHSDSERLSKTSPLMRLSKTRSSPKMTAESPTPKTSNARKTRRSRS
jgi:hypothetical protein